jgi:phosphoribosylamine--glycine ligase
LVLHAGTARKDGQLVSAGGRVFGVAGRGASLREAIDQAYAGAQEIQFEGAFYRKDIGHRAL